MNLFFKIRNMMLGLFNEKVFIADNCLRGVDNLFPKYETNKSESFVLTITTQGRYVTVVTILPQIEII